MAPPDDRLKRLGQVGGVLRDAALARLRTAAQACRRIEAEIAALDAQRRALDDEADPAVCALLGDSRERWYRERRAALNGALARARVEEAMRMKEAARAFGRDDALRRLVHRAEGG
ncbi:hypothetical protein [Rhodovulum euryhalinum]|uniref:Uncharacterized protein n=1 Tax=Rhodovulum euryhalinum TaxID=35805 RepID=A0A4R2KT63_9RHOB|nr:hypothetical protein [Rhodovulum euryhalinum]TCO73368.1 hypothetical protein EV655_102132 [Rhodovulum euryhalinum]